jgi:hypothetical protein
VHYVGSAQGSLHGRMRNYESQQRRGTSGRPVHAKLREAIDSGISVEVHTLEILQPLQEGLHGLPIDYTVGLEAGLIRVINPAWNRRGRSMLLDDIDDSD